MRLATEFIVVASVCALVIQGVVHIREDALEKQWPGITAYKAELAKNELKRLEMPKLADIRN